MRLGKAIWLASYPKSGNTWARLALRSLQLGGVSVGFDDIAGFGNVVTRKSLFDRMLSLDAGMLTETELETLRPVLHDALAAAPGDPVVRKVHDRWHRTIDDRPMFDPAHTHATIYLVRDPRDVVISWARFRNQPIDQAIAFLADPAAELRTTTRSTDGHVAQPLGRWSDHVTSWIDRSGLLPVVLRYEDMFNDSGDALRRMARHIGWTVEADSIAGAVAASSFGVVRDLEERHGFRETPDGTTRFFASGRAGGWRDILSKDQAARIARDHGPVMARFGYS